MKYEIKYKKNIKIGGAATAATTSNNRDGYNYKEEFKNGKPNLDNPQIGIVINKGYGGFGLSDYAKDKLGIENEYDIDRFNPALVRLVEQFRKKMKYRDMQYSSTNINNSYSSLDVEYIPSAYYEGPHRENSYQYEERNYYRINEHDGYESITLDPDKYENDQRSKGLIKLLSMMSEIIINENPELTSDKKIEKLKFFFPPGEIDINRLIENLDYIPGIGSVFLEAQDDFTKVQEIANDGRD